eukprot:Gb_04029 [translate_table: standard]
MASISLINCTSSSSAECLNWVCETLLCEILPLAIDRRVPEDACVLFLNVLDYVHLRISNLIFLFFGALKKSNETMRLIMTAVCGIVLGFFIGVSFPRISFSKIDFPSRLTSTTSDPEDSNSGLATQVILNSEHASRHKSNMNRSATTSRSNNRSKVFASHSDIHSAKVCHLITSRSIVIGWKFYLLFIGILVEPMAACFLLLSLHTSFFLLLFEGISKITIPTPLFVCDVFIISNSSGLQKIVEAPKFLQLNFVAFLVQKFW